MTTTATIPTTALQLRSLVQPDGTLQISLESTPMPTPGPDEVLIQVQATPINPSDIGLRAQQRPPAMAAARHLRDGVLGTCTI